jgi:hypothetical protein
MADPELATVRKLSRVMDDLYVDPILGFVLPGAGDLIGAGMGLYTVAYALRKRVSPVIITRMLMNLSIDAIVGAVPFVGDLFDIGWKAHKKNLALLDQREGRGGRASVRDWLALGAAFLAFASTIALILYAVVALWRMIT